MGNLIHKLKKGISNPKFFASIVTILLLIPLVFAVYAYNSRDTIKIGIVLTTQYISEDGDIAAESLNNFNEFFDAEVLDIYFNESGVRIKNSLYLTDDYFNPDFAEDVRQRFDVDVIFILTRRSINNWLGNGLAILGQANTEYAMCIGTVSQFRNEPKKHDAYMKHIAVHEVLHLLGYLHDAGSKNCVMQYSSINTEICTECKAEFDFRSSIWEIGNGYHPGRGAMLINSVLNSIYAAPVIAIIGSTRVGFKKKIYKKDSINPNPMIYSIGFLFINIMLLSVLINSLYARLFSIGSFVFVYFLLEYGYYQYHLKRSAK